MLVYEKKVDGQQVLYGTMGNIPADTDKELVYFDREGEEITPVEKDTYRCAEKYSITRESDGKFVDVFIDDGETLHNIIPGGIEPGPAKTVVAIEIESQPEKVEYAIGDKFSTKGLAVKVTYSDETTEVIRKGFTVVPANGTKLNEEGTVNVVVTYKEKTVSFDINVVDPEKLTMYFGLRAEAPTTPKELDEETIKLSATEISKPGLSPNNEYVCIAVPNEVGTIVHAYTDAARTIDQIGAFVTVPAEGYQFLVSEYALSIPMDLTFVLEK